jgi:hypothetical protein
MPVVGDREMRSFRRNQRERVGYGAAANRQLIGESIVGCLGVAVLEAIDVADVVGGSSINAPANSGLVGALTGTIGPQSAVGFLLIFIPTVQ